MSYAESEAKLEEKQYMEKIYDYFDSRIANSKRAEERALEYYRSECFENQERQTASSEAHRARWNRMENEQLVASLYDNPYFAHVRIHSESENVLIDCFYSDNDALDTSLCIHSAQEIYLIPFKKDRERPFLSAAYHYYQTKEDEVILVEVRDRSSGALHENTYRAKLIRDVDVFRRELRGVNTFLPKPEHDIIEFLDKQLAQKLDENRNNPGLRNIIATLQREQFRIIDAGMDEDFIVQGCAGSGKTQVLIHRLFYLRDYLSESGWEKVLLITPSQLFRNYTHDLMRRYRLRTIDNTSLATFYRTLLDCFDPRFSERQYLFELSEEYLPDEYLRRVYARDLIASIDAEIDKAIAHYVAEGCRLTGKEMPRSDDIDIDLVNALASELALRVQQFDEMEKLLSEDAEYQAHRQELEKLEKELQPLQKKIQTLTETGNRLKEERAEFDDLYLKYKEALNNVDIERKERESNLSRLSADIRLCVRNLDSGAEKLSHYASFARLRGTLLEELEGISGDAKFRQQHWALLSSLLEQRQHELRSFTKWQAPEKWLEKHEKLLQANEAQLRDAEDDAVLIRLLIEDERKWFEEHDFENVQSQRKAHRAEMERARFFLSRIESVVFENEVWNALAPLKTQYGIQTVFTERLKDSRERRSRVLYKSDLLFYLKIYDKLHKNRSLPEYTLICIDEGQDLHSADYAMIRALYPEAVLNVFGDTGQVLHESCGVSDWVADTGIEKIYELNRNYRSDAAIVQFCNNKFGSAMDYIGHGSPEKAVELTRAVQINASLAEMEGETVVIVKNKRMFDEFCNLIRDDAIRKKLVYLDTKSDKVPENIIPCYSIFAAKGIEFKTALVYAREMTPKQKIVACTRAMDKLLYYGA